MKSTTINSISIKACLRTYNLRGKCAETQQVSNQYRGTSLTKFRICNFQTVKLMPAERIRCSPEITKGNIES